MIRARHVAAISMAVAVTAVCAVDVCLSRIDKVRAAQHGLTAAQADAVRAIDALTDRLAHIPDARAELAACRARTENLHTVLEVLVSSGIGWPERVALPNPPPGWAPWPELGHRDRPDPISETETP